MENECYEEEAQPYRKTVYTPIYIYGCVVFVWCVCFASLDVVCDELYDCGLDCWSASAF